jgi:hypothetical protein
MKSDLVPIDSAPKIRRPYGTGDLPIGPEGLLYAPGGPFMQPVDPGINRQRVDDPMGFSLYTDGHDAAVDASATKSKKAKQWKKWDEEIIPMLMEPYISLLHETESLRNLDSFHRVSTSPGCKGCGAGRHMNVSCIYFESM